MGLFLESGFEGARMAEVARRAGVAKGTLYLYFPTKAALFEGVLTDAVGSPLGAVGRPPPPGESIGTFLLETALPALREIETSGRGDLLRLIMREGPRFPEVAATYRRVVLEPGWRAISALARLARERGELRTDALERLPLLLVAPAVTAVLWNGLFEDEPIDVAGAFEAFVRETFRDVE